MHKDRHIGQQNTIEFRNKPIWSIDFQHGCKEHKMGKEKPLQQEEYMVNFRIHRFSNRFLDITLNYKRQKRNTDRMNNSKIKNFCAFKDTIKKVKKTTH